jgi:hypothetical protein
MMAFDEAKYRAAAKAAGYSDDEIDSELGTKPVVASAPPPNETFSDAQAKAKADYDAKVHKMLNTNVTVGDHTYEIPSFFTSPAGIVTAVGAGIGLGTTILGAAVAAPKAYNAIKDRWINKAPAIDRTVDIPFTAPTASFDTKAAPAIANTGSEWDEIIARSEQNKAAKLADAAAKQGKPVVEAPIVGVMPSGAAATPIPMPPPPPPPPPVSVTQAVAQGGDVGQELKKVVAQELDQSVAPMRAVPPPMAQAAAPQGVPPQELRTGTGKPAFAGQGPEPTISTRTNKPQFKDVYKDVSQVPTGYAFVPNAQYIDIPRQDLGQAEYTKAYSGKDFPATNELAREQSKDINRTLGRATREEAKLAGLPPAEVTPGITKMTTAGKKRVTVGGALGALVALPELANAASAAGQGNAAPARELGFDFGTGALLAKLFGGPAAAAGALALGSSSLNADEQDQLNYRRKIGAGRGIAPPSAYKR